MRPQQEQGVNMALRVARLGEWIKVKLPRILDARHRQPVADDSSAPVR